MLRIAMLLLLAAMSTAQAEEKDDGRRTVIGAAGVSCGTWTKDRESRALEHIYWEWFLAGFVSGVNKVNLVDALRGQDFNALAAWMDNYCRNNPLTRITDAAMQLMNALEQSRR